MLRLHGFRFSNYHSLVRCVLLEKGLPFEESVAYPPADESFLAKNPTGRFPCLELPDGTFLGESKVILNYIEESFPAVPLLPEDAAERARVRELMEVIDLYVEWPARRLYPEVFSSGGSVSPETKAEVRALLERGVGGLRRLVSFDPYIAGSALSLADFSAVFHFLPVGIATRSIYGDDPIAEIPGAAAHRLLMERRPSVARALADQLADQKAFMER